jgi:hypothetical protein
VVRVLSLPNPVVKAGFHPVPAGFALGSLMVFPEINEHIILSFLGEGLSFAKKATHGGFLFESRERSEGNIKVGGCLPKSASGA